MYIHSEKAYYFSLHFEEGQPDLSAKAVRSSDNSKIDLAK